MYKVGDKVFVTNKSSVTDASICGNGVITKVNPEGTGGMYLILIPATGNKIWFYENGKSNIDSNVIFEIGEDVNDTDYKVGMKLVRTKAGNGSPSDIGMVSSIVEINSYGNIRLNNQSGNFSVEYLEKNWEVVKEKEMSKFKVGDLVRGLSSSYGITNNHMTLGRVTEVRSSGSISVVVLSHDDGYDDDTEFSALREKDFELVTSTQNLVYCTFGSKNYAYLTPVPLKKDAKVYVPSGSGKHHCTVSADSVAVTPEFLQIFLKEHSLESIKSVIGFYKEVTTTECVPF